MIESLREVDTDAVKKVLAEARDWTAVCPVCGEVLVGTIAELKAHCHGK